MLRCRGEKTKLDPCNLTVMFWACAFFSFSFIIQLRHSPRHSSPIGKDSKKLEFVECREFQGS